MLENKIKILGMLPIKKRFITLTSEDVFLVFLIGNISINCIFIFEQVPFRQAAMTATSQILGLLKEGATVEADENAFLTTY